MRYLIPTGLLCFALAAAPSLGQSDCAGGVISDDGTFENGLSATSSASSVEYVMRVRPPLGVQRLDRVCVCFTRVPGGDDAISFDLNVYATTAANEPGGLIDTLTAQLASPVAEFPGVTFTSYDLTGLDIEVSTPIFVGPRWVPGEADGVYLCHDQSGPGGAPAFTSSDGTVPPDVALGAAEGYRALGIRAQFTQVEAAAPCVPDDRTLCIDDDPGDGRFQVQVAYQTTQAGGRSGYGKPTSLASLGVSRGGLLTFFSDDNPEMLVKILDACAINGHYWVFYSAGTNVGLETIVIDTQTGRGLSYINPDRTAAAPLQHLGAFPCDGAPGQPLAPSGDPFDFANASSDTVAPAVCTPSATTLCIDDQPDDARFRVEVGYETTQAGGRSGPGVAIPLDSLGNIRGGLLWFFSADNPEMLVKVLNACPVNGHYWVFYSAGTNVGLETTVTDTLTGLVRRYRNPDRSPAPPLQDLTAFPCS